MMLNGMLAEFARWFALARFLLRWPAEGETKRERTHRAFCSASDFYPIERMHEQTDVVEM